MDAIALLGPTKKRILEQLQRSPSTAPVLAEAIGFQVSAIRGHLDALEQQGLVAPRFRRAGVGRPRKVYELTDAGQEMFPRRYHLLLSRMIERLAEKEGRAYTARLLAEIAQELAVELKVPHEGTIEQRAYALAQALNTMGFEATIEQTAQGLVLVRRNCIFMEAAKEHHDLVCGRFDQELVRSALQTKDAKLACCMATGASACHNLLVPIPNSETASEGGSPS
jgi:DeoR family transcriptional regulator, suf operon transcriptional repressor